VVVDLSQPLVYFVARECFKFSRGGRSLGLRRISICNVSAAIATGGAILAPAPGAHHGLLVDGGFTCIEMLALPFVAQRE